MSILSQLEKNLFRLNPITKIKSSRWEPYSRLMTKSDGGNWSLDWDAKELTKVWRTQGVRIADSKYESLTRNQSIFFTSRYDVLLNWKKPRHRIAFPYYHGDPFTNAEFKSVFDSFRAHHEHIHRVQVTNSHMEVTILNAGIDPNKVFRIPIGINLDYFTWTMPELRREARSKLGIPQSAVVIGSFQKDGNGRREGLEPKLIKGPDVFLKTLEILKSQVPEMFVLLTGPARGYVRQGLEKTWCTLFTQVSQ